MAHQIIVLDRHEVVRAVLGDGPSACPILEDLHTEKLENAAITYEFAVPADHPDAQTITPEGYVIIRDVDGLLQELRIKTVEDELDNEGKRIRRVTCENAALELNGSIVRPQTWTGVTASQALTNALTGTRWQPGIVEWSGTRTITIDGYKTVTEVLHQIASEFEAEIRWHVVWQDGRIVGRFVDLLRQRGRYTGKRFEYSKDIVGLRRIEDTTELVTAMIGVGKADENGKRLTFVDVTWSKANGDPADKPQGQDWVGDEDALQRWGLPGGRHIFGIYDDPDEEDPNELLQKTWNALQQLVNSRYTYEVEVALLERLAEQVEPAREPEYYSLQVQFYAQFDGQPLPRGASGWEHEAVRLGDTVIIHDTSVDPPLVLEARVIEVKRSYVDPSRDEVKLGYYRPLITSQAKVVADLQRRLNQKQGTWDSKQRPVAVGSTPPSNPQVNDLWVDTSSTPHVWKRWDGAAWQKATPTQAAEVGAETPAGAQAKANQAEQNAKNAVANGEVPIPTSALQGIIDAAVNLIQATQGWVYIDQNGLTVYDNADPAQATKAVKVGSGGILLANSKDGSGNWVWRTAITGDGIVADEITTGTLTGITIQTGTSGPRLVLNQNLLQSYYNDRLYGPSFRTNPDTGRIELQWFTDSSTVPVFRMGFSDAALQMHSVEGVGLEIGDQNYGIGSWTWLYNTASAGLTRTSDQSVAHNTWTTIAWQLERWDRGNFWESGAPGNIDIPADGVYLILANLIWQSANTGFATARIITANGTVLALDRRPFPSAAAEISQTLMAIAHLSFGDIVQVQVLQTTGASLSLKKYYEMSPEVRIIKLG